MDAPGKTSRGYLRYLLGGLHALSGWFLVYLAVGGLIGFAVPGQGADAYSEARCTPFVTVFGVIESTCPNAAVNWLWDAIVGLPRFVIVFPALAVAFIKTSLLTAWPRWADAEGWLLYSIPLLLLLAAGTQY